MIRTHFTGESTMNHARRALGVLCLTGAVAVHAETVVIEADGYVDVVAGRIVTPGVIVVDGDRIAAVNPAETPAGARRIALPGQTLIPGLMDAHTHLNYIIGEGWETEPVRFTAGDFALRALPHASKTLLAGFTTVRDLGTGLGFSDVALMNAIDKGWAIGPRVIPAGHALSVTGGHCDQSTGLGPGITPPEFSSGTADGVDEVLKAVRYQVKHGARVIKICATAGVLSFEGPAGAQQYTIEEMRAAADEAHRHGLRIAPHAHGTEGIVAASEAGIDSIEHNSMMTDEAAAIIKKNGSFVVPNLHLIDTLKTTELPPALRAKQDYLGPLAVESFRRALKHGLKIAFGTDAGVFPHGDNAKELTARVRHGDTPLHAIQSATIVNAELFGTPDRGRIEAGLLADLIAVAGNPLEDIKLLEDVRFVMKGGVAYKLPAP
jgi:imidazolonepropionase-like amidohydrolase